MLSALKKFAALFLIILGLIIFPVTTLAQSTSGSGTTGSTATNCTNGPCKASDSNFGSLQGADNATAGWVHAFDCGLTVEDPINSQRPGCGYYDAKGNFVIYNVPPGQKPQGGLIRAVNLALQGFYQNPPLSSTTYLANLGSSLGIVQPVYAQTLGTTTDGLGNGVILPVLAIWQVSRNLAYLAFVIIFVVVGIMIMLRQKISAQAVVSIQSALPGLVIGLILVTFSYFIAALIIDLSFIGMQIVAGLFTVASSGNAFAEHAPQVANNGNIINLYTGVIFNGAGLNNIVGPIASYLRPATDVIANATVVSNPILQVVSILPGAGNLYRQGVNNVIGGLAGGIVLLIIDVAIVIQGIRLFWALLQSYIAILVTTVTGPLIILSASLPGGGSRLGGWWRNLLGNVLVFPAVFAAFLFAGVFLGAQPDTNFQQTLPLFTGFPVQFFRAAIGYGIILATPGIPKAVKDAIKATDNPLGQVAAGGFNAARGAFGAGVNQGYRATGIPAQAEQYQRELARSKVVTQSGALQQGGARSILRYLPK